MTTPERPSDERLRNYDVNAMAVLDALPSFLDDVRAFMDAPEKRRSPGSASHRRERLTVSLVWMGKRVEAMLTGTALPSPDDRDRLAALGEAVERLPKHDALMPRPWTIRMDALGVIHVDVLLPGPWRWARGSGPTLPAAIAAALGDRS